MTDVTNNTECETTSQLGIGARLKAAREAMSLSVKEAAARLRLNEKFIVMLENEDFTSTRVPPLFMRGYLRSYGKLLGLDQEEIQVALHAIQHPPANSVNNIPPLVAPTKNRQPEVPSQQLRYMKIFGVVILAAWLSLTGLWWHNHSSAPPTTVTVASNELLLPSIAPAPAAPTAPQPPASIVAAKPPVVQSLAANNNALTTANNAKPTIAENSNTTKKPAPLKMAHSEPDLSDNGDGDNEPGN